MSMNPSRRRVMGIALAAATQVLAPARAQSSRPLRLIIPADPGSGLDTVARASQAALSRALGGQPVLIENNTGAGGTIATALLVNSPPDGHTLSLVSNNHVVNPSVFKKLPYDALNDITAISVLGTIPLVLVAHPRVGRNANDLVAYLKANPGRTNYGSGGNGTIIHLLGQMFADAAKVDVKHIPYKGISPQVNAMVTGEVDFGVLPFSAAQGFLQTGALRAVAAMGNARVKAIPDVPTLVEQGFDVDVTAWFTLIGPARIPPAEVARLNAAFRTAFATPEVLEAMAKQQNIVNPSSPEEATRFLRVEHDRYARLAKSAGIKPD